MEKPEVAYEVSLKSTVSAWDYSRTRFDDEGGTRYPQGYEPFLDDLYERQNTLGECLSGAFARILRMPQDEYLSMVQGDFGTIRLRYPPDEIADADADVGISKHTDFELLRS